MDHRYLRGPHVPRERESLLKTYVKQYWSILILLVIMVFMFLILSIARLYFVYDGNGEDDKIVTVRPGMSVRSIAALLKRENVIDKQWKFVWWVKFKRAGGKLKAGRYRLGENWPIPLVISKLVLGETEPVSFTVPEGLTIRETAGLLQDRIGLDSAVFVGLAHDPVFMATLDVFPEARTLEGFLFPDTYNISMDPDPEDIIRMMVRNFKKVYLEEYAQSPPDIAMSNYRILNLAAIVEREAKLEEERPLIAAVFHNRLRQRIYLESCATINYVLGAAKKAVLSKKDLKIRSPYNTYIHFGLPPGPICSPGRAAIRATMHPADSDVLYFVSRGDGSHEFTTTLRDHINAKHKYKPRYKNK